MAVKIRLTRMGKKRQPSYRVVVIDSRRARDGKYIEQIGRYDPRQEPSLIEIDNDRALHWLGVGAQPTETARKLLEVSGAWTRFRVAKGDIHTIEVGPPRKEEAEAEADATVDVATDAGDDSEVTTDSEAAATSEAPDAVAEPERAS